MGSPQKLELIDRLRPPEETLTPSVMGRRLFEVFEGCDKYRLPSDQVSFLLRHYLIYSIGYANPVFILSSPEEGKPVKPWGENFAISWIPRTTEKYTSNTPHIIPASLHNAPDVITVTNGHHFWKSRREEHDIVISRNGSELTPFWYIKGEDPIKPQRMISLENVVSNPFWNRSENDGATIQLWKLLPAMNTYNMQAALELNKISLKDFLHVLGTKPSDFPS